MKSLDGKVKKFVFGLLFVVAELGFCAASFADSEYLLSQETRGFAVSDETDPEWLILFLDQQALEREQAKIRYDQSTLIVADQKQAHLILTFLGKRYGQKLRELGLDSLVSEPPQSPSALKERLDQIDSTDLEDIRSILRKSFVVISKVASHSNRLSPQNSVGHFFITLGAGIYEIGVAVFVADKLIEQNEFTIQAALFAGMSSVVIGLGPLLPIALYFKYAPHRKSRALLRSFLKGVRQSIPNAKRHRFKPRQFFKAQLESLSFPMGLYDVCRGFFRFHAN